jgi:hypothetical protein
MPVKIFESICKKEKSRHRLLPGLPGLENERVKNVTSDRGLSESGQTDPVNDIWSWYPE